MAVDTQIGADQQCCFRIPLEQLFPRDVEARLKFIVLGAMLKIREGGELVRGQDQLPVLLALRVRHDNGTVLIGRINRSPEIHARLLPHRALLVENRDDVARRTRPADVVQLALANQRPARLPVADEIDDVGAGLRELIERECAAHAPDGRRVVRERLFHVGNQPFEVDGGVDPALRSLVNTHGVNPVDLDHEAGNVFYVEFDVRVLVPLEISPVPRCKIQIHTALQ